MSERLSPRGPFETEIAFVITSKMEDIARDIAGLSTILSYDLKPAPVSRFHDYYYDLPGGILRQRRISLRVRRVENSFLVSTKSNAEQLIGHGVRRIEIEDTWSEESWNRVMNLLRLKQSQSKVQFYKSSPMRTFSKTGLITIQQRKTRRVVRQILARGKPKNGPIAELDIDYVTFLGTPRVRLIEVEVEAKTSKSLREIQKIAEALHANYPQFLQEWRFGKLATGIALQRLWRLGTLQRYVNRDYLRAEAYTILENSLRIKTTGRP